MNTCFFSQILEQAGQWQVHLPATDAFGHMVLRPLVDGVTLPCGAGLVSAEWSEKARAFNCEVDALYLMNKISIIMQLVDIKQQCADINEINFLALRFVSIARQTHPMPDAGRVMLAAFQVLWAGRAHQTAAKNAASYTNGFLRDLRLFTEENLHLRARYSTHNPEKSPIQKGESCAIVAKNGLLMLRAICASVEIPARFLEA